MDWFKQHADTLVILGSFALCFWTLNEKMNDRFNILEKDIHTQQNMKHSLQTRRLMTGSAFLFRLTRQHEHTLPTNKTVMRG